MVDEWQRGKVARRSGGQCLGTCLGTRGPQCCDMWGTVWATSGMVWYMTGYTLASYRPLNTSNIRQGVGPCPLHSSRHPPSRGPNRQKAGCNSASSRGSKLRVDDHCKGQVSRSRKAIPSVQLQFLLLLLRPPASVAELPTTSSLGRYELAWVSVIVRHGSDIFLALARAPTHGILAGHPRACRGLSIANVAIRGPVEGDSTHNSTWRVSP